MILCDTCSPRKQCTADKNRTECKYYQPMTNEEWIKSCNTEQLAEYLWRSKKSYWSTHLEDTDKMEIEDMLWWLKQPHTTIKE